MRVCGDPRKGCFLISYCLTSWGAFLRKITVVWHVNWYLGILLFSHKLSICVNQSFICGPNKSIVTEVQDTLTKHWCAAQEVSRIREHHGPRWEDIRLHDERWTLAMFFFSFWSSNQIQPTPHVRTQTGDRLTGARRHDVQSSVSWCCTQNCWVTQSNNDYSGYRIQVMNKKKGTVI